MVDCTRYTATRITYASAHGFAETRARLEERVPLFDQTVALELVLSGATWAAVEAAVNDRVGPDGLVALARLDQGALVSLSGRPLEATLYLVGNPLVARDVTHLAPAAALYAPFRVAVFSDAAGVHLAYDRPSSVFASLGSEGINKIAVELDDKIEKVAQAVCRGA